MIEIERTDRGYRTSATHKVYTRGDDLPDEVVSLDDYNALTSALIDAAIREDRLHHQTTKFVRGFFGVFGASVIAMWAALFLL